MRFTIPDSLLQALRARRDGQRRQRADVPTRLATALVSQADTQLDGQLQEAVVSSMPDVERVAAQSVDGMNQRQDAVETEQDAFLLDPGMGPMTYITADGRILLDMHTWDGAPLREATDDEAIVTLVAGAEKTSIGELLDLIPEGPPDGLQCPMCAGTRWFTFGELRLVCRLCHGRGWATQDEIARAEADGTWPLRHVGI